jgi:hypothetical protein
MCPADTVCHRHQRWQDAAPPDQIRIAAAPEIAQAARHHRVLISRYGTLGANDAYVAATGVCRRWFTTRDEPAAWADRATRLTASPHWPDTGPRHAQPSTIAYPEAVALTAIFLSPELRALAASGQDADLEEFYREIAARTGHRHIPYTVRHPITHWISDLRREPRCPPEPAREA